VSYQQVVLVSQAIAPTFSQTLSKCMECYAVVETVDQTRHDAWHQALALTSMQHVTHLTLPSEEMKRLQYWVDALFVLIGEDPVFLPEWDEARGGTGV